MCTTRGGPRTPSVYIIAVVPVRRCRLSGPSTEGVAVLAAASISSSRRIVRGLTRANDHRLSSHPMDNKSLPRIPQPSARPSVRARPASARVHPRPTFTRATPRRRHRKAKREHYRCSPPRFRVYSDRFDSRVPARNGNGLAEGSHASRKSILRGLCVFQSHTLHTYQRAHFQPRVYAYVPVGHGRH